MNHTEYRRRWLPSCCYSRHRDDWGGTHHHRKRGWWAPPVFAVIGILIGLFSHPVVGLLVGVMPAVMLGAVIYSE